MFKTCSNEFKCIQMCSNGFKTCSNLSNVFQPVQNLFKFVQMCLKLLKNYKPSSAWAPTWQAELDLVLPALCLCKSFQIPNFFFLQISNRRSGRGAISSPIWCCVHRSLTSSQTCRDHYQQSRKKLTRKKRSPISTK